jgi:hypothetical protein
MRLTLANVANTSATLYLNDDDIVTVQSARAPIIAREIARAVNRDDQFEALVTALTPFRSNEMGGLLVNMIDIREPKAAEAEKQLRMLVNFIDVILNTVELRDEINDIDVADGHRVEIHAA